MSNIINIVSYVLTFIFFGLNVIQKLYTININKKLKEKDYANATLITDLTAVKDLTPKIMEMLENVFSKGNGEIKLSIAKEYIKNFYLENNITYNDEMITNVIKTFVDMSKIINKKVGDEKNEKENANGWTTE